MTILKWDGSGEGGGVERDASSVIVYIIAGLVVTLRDKSEWTWPVTIIIEFCNWPYVISEDNRRNYMYINFTSSYPFQCYNKDTPVWKAVKDFFSFIY